MNQGVDQNDVRTNKVSFVGASFSFKNRAMRVLWGLCYALLFWPSPRVTHRWRLLLLKLFGADVSWRAYVYPSTRIWAPWNLTLADYATLGPGVTCYNVARISVGFKAVVSQGTHLCSATHDYDDPAFQLYARPITLESQAWVAAECFLAPGVTVGEQAIVGARAVISRDVPARTIWAGNPARQIRERVTLYQMT